MLLRKERPAAPCRTLIASPADWKLRRDALSIFHSALEGADAERLVMDAMRLRGGNLHFRSSRARLPVDGRVYVFGAGKPAAAMARGVERKIGKRIAGGIVIAKPGHGAPLRRVRLLFGSHPRAGARSLSATRQMLRALGRVECGGSVLFLWSGGASSLLFKPREGLSAAEKLEAISLLMDAGADVRQLNAGRKHLSAVKGGQLIRCVPDHRIVSLVLSDVCGDNPATVGSGPTFPDDTSFDEAVAAFREFGVWTKCSRGVRALLQAGAAGRIRENPGKADRLFRSVRTVVIGTSREALDAAARCARRLGYRTFVVARQLQGDTEAAAHLHAAIAAATGASAPCCLLSGGETTVKLPARHGKGGRNQHFVLASALLLERKAELAGLRWAVLSGGTDGTDGPTEAAGAIADTLTLSRAGGCGIDAASCLRRRDSYPFFQRLGDLVRTGPTGTNVMDLRIVLLSP